MSNERIDLTQFEEITKGTWEVKEPEHPHYGVIRIHPCSATVRRYQRDWKTEEAWYANAKAIAAVPDLIAELKRCYEELDFLRMYVLTYEDNHWIATCKPDGEGQCTMMIEDYEELMRLNKEGKIEIPEYSHGYDELLLYECECGVTHDEWLEGKN